MSRWLALAACALLLLTGCGAAGEANPRKIGPRGVDELVIPTPDPDPDDFVAVVDNPWLPLAAGTRWTYDVTGSEAVSLEVEVEEKPEPVHGVSCVVVRQTGTDDEGNVVYEAVAYYAQDDRGNVWLFGEETDDRASVMGDPGLAMPATPRVGDGYVRADLSGGLERSTVLSLDQERTVPAGTFGDLLVVEDVTEGSAGNALVERVYAEGVGLVQQTSRSGGGLNLALVSVTPPG